MKVWLVEFLDYTNSYISLVATSADLAVSLTKEDNKGKGEWSGYPPIDEDKTSFILRRDSTKTSKAGISYTDSIEFFIEEHEVKES